MERQQLSQSSIFTQNKCLRCHHQLTTRFCETCIIAYCDDCWLRDLKHERRVCPACCRHLCVNGSYTLMSGFQEVCDDCLKSLSLELAATVVDEALD